MGNFIIFRWVKKQMLLEFVLVIDFLGDLFEMLKKMLLMNYF